MVGNQACIAIGINQYQFFQPLSYAQQDAQALQNFLVGEVGLPPERCLLLTDSSPSVGGHSTYPNRETIEEWVKKFCQRLGAGDILWLFWCGYGVRENGEEYLMPQEGNPKDVAASGIAARSLLKILKSAQEGVNPPLKLLLLLDINRSGEIGTEIAALAKKLKIPTILSCLPDQFSRESGVLRHGLFTAALLECLRYSRCVTIKDLICYLSQRLPQLSEHLWLPPQEPLVAVNPPENMQQLIWQPKENGAIVNRELLVLSSTGRANGNAVYNYDNYKNGSSSRGQKNGQLIKGKNEISSQSLIPLSVDTDKGKDWQTKAAIKQQYLLMWSGVAVVMFVLGALASRWLFSSNYSQDFQPVTPVTPEVAQSSPTARVQSESEAVEKQQQQSSQLLLDKATLAILPLQASQFASAIAIARQISANDPLYPQAQENIDRWGSIILDIAKARAKQGNFAGALAAAQLVPKDRLVLAEKAKQLIAQWQKEAALQQANQNLIQAASLLARRKQLTSYVQAIASLSSIKPGQPKYTDAQQLIAQWSQAILDIAKARAARRQFNAAIAAAEMVPAFAPVYAEAEQLIAQWQQRRRRY
ncbi:MAG: caspase family protein [Oscillatoriaceae bacterium SKW80]|nr:caspase family protein [Oscillatoriaceae bacterium SKYG93]MCX8121297.1 caspase family protein [Oscillatoriaceae bacterium SKW80]MDW8453369.1 caspase family protein [Oscillatoriaceae cyanobacterium SKYGB_i_bin93]HIK26723.1 caspase family protein [Oscillatoriaceae cyanobacterium M7585_C2015_266]